MALFFLFRKTGLTQLFTTGREEAVSFKNETRVSTGERRARRAI
jgi:hypothetical protein